MGPHWGNWGGGPSTRNFGNLLKEGSGYAASLSMAALFGEPGEGVPLLGGPEGYERKALGTGISLYGDSVGQPGVG